MTSQDDAFENPLESDFFVAMNAYRAAKASGDPEAIARAEDAWREQVRAEIIEQANRGVSD